MSPNSPGTVVVRGRWQFCESDAAFAPDCTRRNLRRQYAELWDSDLFGQVGPLATTHTGEDGTFEFPAVENSDGFLEGTLDIYVKVFTNNGVVRVGTTSTNLYVTSTTVYSNVPDGSFDVGTWISAGDRRGADAIFDTILIGYDYALASGHTNPKVTVLWPGPGTGSSTELDGVTINIAGGGGDQDEWDEDNILHEYGHSVQFHVYGAWIPNSVGSHTWNQCTNNNFAFSEGWPTFWGVAIDLERGYGDQLYPQDTWYRDEFRPDPITHDLEVNAGAGFTRPECVESTIATTLWDIYDNAVDGRDNLAAGMNPIWDVFANYITGGHHVYTTFEFWDGWFARGHACQFCASARQIWGIYMDHGMNQDPNAPQNPNAASGSHTPSVWSNDDTIFASWTGADDDISGVEGYSIEWSTSATTIPDATIDVTVASATSQVLPDGNSWWLHVRTRDSAGNWSPGAFHWGPFFIDTVPPLPPTLQSPPNGLTTTSTTLTFTWLASTDATSGVASYNLKLVRPGITTTWYGITTTSFTVTNLGVANYTWQVAAVDNAGNTAWSVTWSFSVLNQPPQWPAGSSLTYTKKWSTADNAWKITLTWPQATDDRAVTGYKVYFYDFLLAALPATQTSYVDFLPAYDGDATYNVYAVDGDGGVSAPLSVTFYVGCLRGRPCPVAPAPDSLGQTLGLADGEVGDYHVPHAYPNMDTNRAKRAHY